MRAIAKLVDLRLLTGAFLAAYLIAAPSARAEQDEITGTTKSTESKDESPTAQQSGMGKVDTELTAQVRRAIVADKNLSMSAHNVKIITKSGVVTLKGPVKSVEERNIIGAKAKEIAGDMNVKNEVDVAP